MPGHIGNATIGGHRVSRRHPFRDLDTLHPGDTVTMNVAAGSFTSTIAITEIVLPSAVRTVFHLQLALTPA